MCGILHIHVSVFLSDCNGVINAFYLIILCFIISFSLVNVTSALTLFLMHRSILGFLVFHKVFFQTSGKKTSKRHLSVSFIALYLFVSDLNYNSYY